MANIRDVARRAKVSIGTVSNVLSGVSTVGPELRERVHAAMRELDFQPNLVARSLKANRTHTLGMVISDITNPFFPQLVRGAEEAALQQGYLLITFNTDDKVERERRFMTILKSRRVDGVLLVVAPGDGDFGHIRSMVEARIPVVCLDRVPPSIQLDSVRVDNVKGAKLAVRHLLQLGHRRIAIITGTLALQNAKGRLKGYRAALEEAGIEPDPHLVLQGDFREETGYLLGKELLLRSKRPTAVFASNSLMALGVLHAMNEIGMSCPTDLAIVSFDDLPIAAPLRPQLTAVAQPGFEIGYKGAELLIRRIRGELSEDRRTSIVLEPELKIRESTTGRTFLPYVKPNRVGR